jgi:hypothetical protein
LTRVRGSPIEILQEVEESRCHQRRKKWANPVDPVISGEAVVDYVGTEGPSWIYTRTSIVDACTESAILMFCDRLRREWTHCRDAQ